jgi:hypothetical protein
VLVTETPAAWALLAILTIAGVGFSRTIRIVTRTYCGVVARRARRARASPCQHFLKRTLFFSMCWCIRDVVHFDSRVHAAIKPSHYIRRATWPRKLRRQRRRRAQ